MPIPVFIAFLAPLIPKLVAIFKAVPANQHKSLARGISMYYRKFGLQQTKDLIMNAGTVAGIYTALKKIFKDDF